MPIFGRYCHLCGQENLEPKETVWHLILHFFNDITHFDGKFFSTVKFLLTRPGYLSLQYMHGRRSSFLNPIRMYVFTSAIFFIIVFSFKKTDELVQVNDNKNESLYNLAQIKQRQEKTRIRLAQTRDESDREDIQENLSNLGIEVAYIQKKFGDTSTRIFTADERNAMIIQAIKDSIADPQVQPEAKGRLARNLTKLEDPASGSNLFGWHQGQYKTVAAYDSIQKAKPAAERDSWFKQKIMASLIHTEEEYRQDPKRYKEKYKEQLIHSFPKILFFSLPFFALILNVLYFRHKKYYYVDHGIFTIHLYCATFLLMLVTVFLSKLDDWTGWGWFHVVSVVLITAVVIYMLIYLYVAMRGFYKQGWFKTFVKYFITGVVATVINLVLLVLFAVIAAVTV
jgi:hypothetical protein